MQSHCVISALTCTNARDGSGGGGTAWICISATHTTAYAPTGDQPATDEERSTSASEA